MLYALRQTTIQQGSRETGRQAQPSIELRKQRHTAVRAQPFRRELDHQRLRRKPFEQDGLMRIVGHAGEGRCAG